MTDSEMYTDWMEGVKAEDYCLECGTPLHDVWVMPNGEKRIVAHTEGSRQCHDQQEQNAIFLES